MRVAAEGFCELLLPALRDTAPSARPFTCFSDSLFSRPEDLCAGVLLLGVTLLLGFLMVPALFFALLLEVLLLTELLLLLAELFCWALEELLRVADVLLLLEEELRVVVALFFCCEPDDEEEDDRTADVLFDEEEELRVAEVLFEEEDELLDAELELFEDDDVLRVAEVALELPPLRVCAAAGTLQTSAPARRAASVSLNSFIIF